MRQHRVGYKDGTCGVLVPLCFPLVWIAQEFELDGLVVQCVFAQECNDLVETVPRGSVLVEQVAREENKVDLVQHCQRCAKKATWTRVASHTRGAATTPLDSRHA